MDRRLFTWHMFSTFNALKERKDRATERIYLVFDFMWPGVGVMWAKEGVLFKTHKGSWMTGRHNILVL